MSDAGQLTGFFKTAYTSFRQLPTAQQVGGVTAVGVTVLCVVAAWRSHAERVRRATPQYAVQVIDRTNTLADLEQNREFFTPQGLKVARYCIANQKPGPDLVPKTAFSEPTIRGSTCYFPFTQGDLSGYFQLQKGSEVWQFDDIVISRQGGRTIDLSAAWAIDHPYLAAWKTIDWGEVFKSFLDGFKIGLALAGG